MKKSIFRIALCFVLLLSLSLTSVFAASYSVPYAEPPTTDNAGYVSLVFDSGNIMTYWWNCQAGTTDNMQVSPVVHVTLNDTTINFNFTCVPNAADYVYTYNLSRRTGSYVWLMSAGTTDLSNSSYHNFSSLGSVVGITYGGNIGSISGFSQLPSASIRFESTSTLDNFYSKTEDIYDLLLHFNNNNDDNLESILGKLDKLDSIQSSLVNFNNNNYDNLRDIVDAVNELNANVTNLTVNNQKWLGYIFDRLELTNVRLTSILDILKEFKATTLEESTEPLPTDDLNNYESQQGTLKNESDVSSSLDDVFNDADFGSFSNGFNAIWGLFGRILSVNPILNLVLALVLTLGLVNLIFNRR